jgi:ubiquinone/menaquinone biosynthesis C-methylase UbiE
MPVDVGLNKDGMIYQREQYAKGGIGVRYWDYRDEVAFRYVAGNVIIDVGCGEGITLEKLLKTFPGKNIRGVDAEDENIRICTDHNLPVIAGDVYQLPFEDNSVDCVLFSEVIEHLDHPESALAEIRRVLQPEGRVIIIFPNDFMFKVSRMLTGMVKEALYDPGHVKQWTPDKIRHSLTSQGFSIIKGHSLPFVLWPVCLHHIAVAQKGCK